VPLFVKVRIPLILYLLAAIACKGPSETISEKPAAIKSSSMETPQPQYEKGVLVFKVRDDYKTSFPEYDKDSPSLGEYPHLGELMHTFQVQSVSAFDPSGAQASMGKFYKVRFEESLSLDDFRKALEKVKVIERVEKVPVNNPK